MPGQMNGCDWRWLIHTKNDCDKAVLEHHLLVLLLALIVDRLVGDPHWLWRAVPHPVVLFGKAISLFDAMANRDRHSAAIRRRNGVLVIVVLLLISVIVGAVLDRLLAGFSVIGLALEVIIVAVLLAQKSLADHVGNVAIGLRQNGLSGGREAVSLIVGRDPQSLDKGGVCRAAIESIAENFSDGVVAPVFWYALFGLPGLFAYKMLNTADSMIGHKNARYSDFGWASARLDDYANWPAARLSAVLIAAGAWVRMSWRAAIRAITASMRDAGLHRSPNAGWPESAMAGALGVSLAGERIYGGVVVREPLLNAAGRRMIDAGDIDRAIGVFFAACSALLVLVVLLLIAANAIL